MIVCIAEKPSVAKDIARVLGANSQRDGYMEGNGYQVTWTFGHLCELKEPHEYYPQWKQWSLGQLPMIPPRFGIKLKADKGIEKQFGIIERLMQAADGIVNCGDAGQEGELIQRWVMQKAKAKCPVKRLWISSLTEEAIREGFQNLKDQSEYQSLYEAGLARAIGDWTLGMNATRLYTLKYRQGQGQVLSIGRVQTPTLALIVRRQEEIENFVPRQSWVLSTLYRDVKFSAIARDEDAEAEDAAQVAEAAKAGKTQRSKGPIYKAVEYNTEAEGKDVLESIKNNLFTVISVNKKNGTEASPRLYDLTSLQVDCNKKFGFSADTTLQLIQSLYEKKFTTYPRVDTTFLPDDVYPKCPQIMNGLFLTKFAGVQVYAPLVKPLGGKALKKSKKVFDNSKVTDHHAIIPTGVQPNGLSDMEQKVFDLVSRAFIAAFYDDCKFEMTTVMGKVPLQNDSQQTSSEQDETKPHILFRATFKRITDEGWKVVFKKTESADVTKASPLGETGVGASNLGETGDGVFPSFVKGESGPHTPTLTEKWTSPPKPYTEATLLRAMETAGKLVESEELRDALKENGIGRPSTRAAIIETLFRRRYIRKERTSLWATPTGVELIHLIHEELLKSAELTGRWERKLRQIEHHEYETKRFVDELKQMVNDIVLTVLADNSNRHVPVTEEEKKKKKK
ncbi:MAG: DNA topoisomerase 3 [Bacteroidales bacterium]|nr:DNA topoisomerase 3 [Bacteroidales bacterium]